jgi:hypothetical protein
VDDQVRSLTSSDPGSAIEGFGQKIPLHNKLTDLGVKFRNLGVAVGLNLGPFVVEHLGQLFNGLALPCCNLGRMQFVLGRQFRNRPVVLIASSATLALNSAVNRLRVLMVDHPLRQQIHLNRLSQKPGPPQSCCLVRHAQFHLVGYNFKTMRMN